MDEKGQIKEAISYGTQKRNLLIWYDYEEVRETFPKWELPSTPKWENTEDWYNGLTLGMGQRGRSRGSRGSRGSDRGRGRGSGEDRSSQYEDEREENSGIGRGGAMGTYRKD